jgi:hypothetical protein
MQLAAVHKKLKSRVKYSSFDYERAYIHAPSSYVRYPDHPNIPTCQFVEKGIIIQPKVSCSLNAINAIIICPGLPSSSMVYN